MLPFLKNRDDGVGVGPIQSLERKPDAEPQNELLDAVAEDILLAIEKKDKKILKEALEALCQHIASSDEEQDAEEMKG